MRIIELEQGTPEWYAWRKTGIGASEAPIILGISPYKSAHKLWQEKTGAIAENNGSSYVFEKGKEIEAKARAYFELMNDKDCPPICMEMDEYPFIKASLDGYNAAENFALEIKYVGKDSMEDQIPAHHYAQLQHQMMVSGASDETYIRSNDGVKFKADVVKRDQPFIDVLLEKEKEFQKMVVDKIEPPLPEKKSRKKKSAVPV